MKRIAFPFLSLLTVLLSSCGGSGGAPIEEPHQHDFSIAQHDETHHWKKCSGCDEIEEKEEHQFLDWDFVGNEEEPSFERECHVCHYEQTSADISYSVSLSNLEETFGAQTPNTLSSVMTVIIDGKTTTYSYEDLDFDFGETDTWDTEMSTTYVARLKSNPNVTARGNITLSPRTSLKVLFIGNSFSQDTVTYLPRVAKSLGVNLDVHHAFIGGCSLDTHYNNLVNNVSDYYYSHYDMSQMKWVNAGSESVPGDQNLASILKKEEFDVISIQQVSTESGLPGKYANLGNLISAISDRITNPDTVQFAWNMTWAYPVDSTSSGFTNYGNDQMTMYNAICNTVQEKVLSEPRIRVVIPNGTTIQNARTSCVEEYSSLHRDALHLSDGVGRYFASLTAMKALTGQDISSIGYHNGNELVKKVAIESVNNACANRYSVTPSKITEITEDLKYIEDYDTNRASSIDVQYDGDVISEVNISFKDMIFGEYGTKDALTEKYFNKLKQAGYISISYVATATNTTGKLSVCYYNASGQFVPSYLSSTSTSGSISLKEISKQLSFWCYEPNTGTNADINIQFTYTKPEMTDVEDLFVSATNVLKYWNISSPDSSTSWGKGNQRIVYNNVTAIRFTQDYIDDCESAGLKSISFDLTCSENASNGTTIIRMVRWDVGGQTNYTIYNGTSARITVDLSAYFSDGARVGARPSIIFQDSGLNNQTTSQIIVENYVYTR